MRTRLILALVVIVLCIGGPALADNPPRDVEAQARPPFEAPDAEAVYVQQSLRAIYILGWNRGDQQDSWWDWQMGQRYVFEPWAVGYPRDVWTQTPGARFAWWWSRYPMNCDNEVTEELVAQLAEDFDNALEGVAAR